MSVAFHTSSDQTPAEASPSARRWTVFVYQDAVLLTTTIRALAELDLLDSSLGGERCLADLRPDITPSGFGYLRVGLRCLASQGWLEAEPTLEPETTSLRWTADGKAAAQHFDDYVAAGRFLARFGSAAPGSWSRPWSAEEIQPFLALSGAARDRWRLGVELEPQLRTLVRGHLDGSLAVPTMLSLRSRGLLGSERPELPEDELGAGFRDLLATLGWIDADSRWTANGRRGAECSVHFGMAASYLPMLSRLPELFAGEAVVAPETTGGDWHVQRALNVNASAAAHTRYFAEADSIFGEVFNREPLEAQPKFVADMGCGDGSWLVHLHELIVNDTLRGAQIERYPLRMVGLDVNPQALEQARRVLDDAGIPAILARGDIGDPDGLAVTLAEQGLAIEDGLHIRAFTDHDRAYRGGDRRSASGWSSGAYVDREGRALDAAAVEADFAEHLRRWAPHVEKHGLVMLEAHCVAPRIARKHLGATHSVAFDAYHGYSHQYPIEHSAFRRCCRQAGLQPASHLERRWPASRPFVAVSLNRLRVPESEATLPGAGRESDRQDSWQPDAGADLADGRALHELLYADGDLRYPRLWCSAATGYVVAGALAVIEQRLEQAHAGDVIRVLDYGSGTGLAAIELLRACRECGLEQRLERSSTALEVHLVDLPSSWFAQGFALLSGCAWTQFHSLRAGDGGFRELVDVTGGRRMDVVMANMVFHLIPPSAHVRTAQDLFTVTAPGGRLVWSSPDLGPRGDYSMLFHDANRTLRSRWLALLADAEQTNRAAPQTAAPSLVAQISELRAGLDEATRRASQARAERRILSDANTAEAVLDALSDYFDGGAEIQTHEILDADLLDTLLVPSNQSEYLPEVADRALRERLIRWLMLERVLPQMRSGAAGTAMGLNIQWTLGSATRAA